MANYHQQPYPPHGPVRANKDVAISYILLVFLGTLGVHKFYLNQMGWGIVYLALGLIGWSTIGVFVGIIFLIPLYLLMFIDLFTIPGRVRALNYGAY